MGLPCPVGAINGQMKQLHPNKDQALQALILEEGLGHSTRKMPQPELLAEK